MLILTRKLGESVVLDGGIEIKITELSGSQVKLGITAPPAVKVYRGELYTTIQENQSAAYEVDVNAIRDLLQQMK